MRDELRTLIGGIASDEGPRLPDPSEISPLFFGRGAELDLLRGALASVRLEAKCRSVLVMGQAGIGKTRVLDEFVRGLQLLNDPPMRVFNAVAPSQGPPWSCFTQIMNQRFQLANVVGPEEAKALVRSQVAEVLDDRKVGDVLYLLGDLLLLEFPGSPITKALEAGDSDAGALRAVLKSFLEADAAFGPICLVFDDLHLCDDQTLSMLHYLVESVNAPVLFLSAARHEILARRPDWANDERKSFVHLEALGEVDTSALLGSLLVPGGMSPMYLVEQAREVTGGNPGRIEEAARYYRDKGTLPPPPSAEEASVDARIEALARSDRLLLQKAALMGGVFWVGALVVLDRAECEPTEQWYAETDPSRARLEERLTRLVESNYILRLPDSTFAGDEEYVFRRRAFRDHIGALTSVSDTRKWHRLLAAWLEGQPETRTHEEYLEMLAEQHEKSGAQAMAASAYLDAAERAREHGAPKRELACYEKALFLLGHDSQERRLSATLRVSELLEVLRQPKAALTRYRDALTLAFRLDRKAKGASAQAAIERLTGLLTPEVVAPPSLDDRTT